VPVVPEEAASPSAIWIVLLVFVLIALFAFLAWSFYKMKLAKNSEAPLPDNRSSLASSNPEALIYK